MKTRFLATLALSTAALAQAQQPTAPDWASVKPMTSIAVSATDKPGVYKVSAVITDLATEKVVAKPVLLTEAGKRATIEFGARLATVYKFVVTVDDKGQAATYRSELLRAGVVESGQSGTLAIDAGT